MKLSEIQSINLNLNLIMNQKNMRKTFQILKKFFQHVDEIVQVFT